MHNTIEMTILIFISDLDGTIVYSGYPEDLCVEYRGEDEITYMTAEAHKLFSNLLNKPDFIFIPCTLRSVEQTCRISFIKEGKAEWLICDNGFSIYHNGILDKHWDSVMQAELSKYPNDEIYQRLFTFVASHSELCRIKDNRSAFFTIIFDNAEIANTKFSEIISIVGSESYNFNLQGRKMYILPKFLNKALAVEYLLNRLPKGKTITAGDSSVDELFMQCGNVIIIPKHSQIQKSSAIITNNRKIKAGEDIIKTVYNEYSHQAHKKIPMAYKSNAYSG